MPTDQAANPLIPLILIFILFYFLILRPQKKEQDDKKKMLGNLKKNDKVVTTAGIHGTVVTVKEKTVIIRVDEKAKIEFDRDSITTVKQS